MDRNLAKTRAKDSLRGVRESITTIIDGQRRIVSESRRLIVPIEELGRAGARRSGDRAVRA